MKKKHLQNERHINCSHSFLRLIAEIDDTTRVVEKAKQFEKSTARVWLVYTVWKPNVATIRCKKILQATPIRRCKPIFLYMSSDNAFTLNTSQYQILFL